MSSVEFQPRTQIFINPAAMLKFYGAVITPEFTSYNDMWKITSGKEIYSTSQVTMDFDSYYSTVNFYGDQVSIKSGFVSYGDDALNSINVSSSEINYMVFRDCGTAFTIIQGNVNIEYLVVSNCNCTGIFYASDVESSANVLITKCIINNIAESGIGIKKAGSYNINNCYLNNTYHNILIESCNGIIINNDFNLGYFYIYFYRNCYHNEVHYNNFYDTDYGLRLTGRINNISNNNFFGLSRSFIYILSGAPPYSLVSSEVNATNNYWAMEEVSQYLADAEDDPRCPYHIIYLPKLENPVREAGIQ